MEKEANSKPRILVDLDGVIRDFISGLKNAYLGQYPDHSIKEITSRDLPKYFPIGDKINDFLDREFNKILLEAPCYEGAIEPLQKWEATFHIVIVTAQQPQYRYSTFSWIGNHALPTDEVQITFNKQNVDGYALLDDFPENLESFARTDRLAVCMDQPWNKDWQGPRVKTVNQFFELVQQHLTNN